MYLMNLYIVILKYNTFISNPLERDIETYYNEKWNLNWVIWDIVFRRFEPLRSYDFQLKRYSGKIPLRWRQLTVLKLNNDFVNYRRRYYFSDMQSQLKKFLCLHYSIYVAFPWKVYIGINVKETSYDLNFCMSE